MKAQGYILKQKGVVKCLVCPHECIIHEGRTGICQVRKNIDGELNALTYRKYSGISFDPVEKKPLYHFFPGREILSVGSVGCNMKCMWCQNCEISQARPDQSVRLTEFLPEELLRIARDRITNIGIAFTYNEPLINIESNLEVADLFKSNNLSTVMVTNGYFSEISLSGYLKVIDAFNIDIKAFREETYKRFTGSTLEPVLKSIKEIKDKGKHVELTYLIVPGVNDDFESFSKLCQWIKSNTGEETVLHISRYFPRYQMKADPTSEETLLQFARKASEHLKYVYAGNIQLGEYTHTLCPGCKTKIITRYGYMVRVHEHAECGNCPECGMKIFIS